MLFVNLVKMADDLNELMRRINKKFEAQREVFEQRWENAEAKIQELQEELKHKDITCSRLKEENEKLRRSTMKSGNVADHKVEMISSGVMTDTWEAIVEDELKQRLEAFVELCRENSHRPETPETSHRPDTPLEIARANISSSTPKRNNNVVDLELENDRKMQPAILDSTGVSEMSLATTTNDIERMERSLMGRYENLTNEAKNLIRQ